MPSFKIIGLLVLEKIFLKVSAIYSRGSHLGHVTWTKYKLSFPLPKDAPYEVWLRLTKGFQRRCLNIVDNDDDDDGAWVYIL